MNLNIAGYCALRAIPEFDKKAISKKKSQLKYQFCNKFIYYINLLLSVSQSPNGLLETTEASIHEKTGKLTFK
jgi:hypothetical protein